MNDELTDLQRILGYAGAAASGDEYTELAADILVTPFWTPSFCATLIRAAEATGAFEPNPHDPVPGHEVSLAAISPQLFEAVQNDVGGRLWPRLKRVWPYVDYVGLRDAFVIKYELGGQEELRIHHDVAQVSASIKLNDDYTGAELRFPRQNAGNASVAVGDALGVAVARDPSAPVHTTALGHQVLLDDLVRGAEFLSEGCVSLNGPERPPKSST
ncbi:MAG: hypothetical protein V9E89_08625 [Ilumatobacteraceae bacterium]